MSNQGDPLPFYPLSICRRLAITSSRARAESGLPLGLFAICPCVPRRLQSQSYSSREAPSRLSFIRPSFFLCFFGRLRSPCSCCPLFVRSLNIEGGHDSTLHKCGGEGRRNDKTSKTLPSFFPLCLLAPLFAYPPPLPLSYHAGMSTSISPESPGWSAHSHQNPYITSLSLLLLIRAKMFSPRKRAPNIIITEN